jgi:integrase
MPKAKVDLSVELDDAAQRFLETKRASTRVAYEKCLKRWRCFYPGGLRGFIEEIEGESKSNVDRPLAERVRPGEAAVRKFIAWHGEAGYSGNATRQSLAALQNALKFYGISMSFDFIALPAAIPMKANEKHQWTLDQMRRFVEVAEYLRDKAFIACAFQSGLGISDLIALNYGDVRRDLEGGRLPLMIHLFRGKTGVEHRSFVGRDSVKYLREYLATRTNLRDDSPLFAMLGSERRVTVGAIQKMMRDYARKVDFIVEEDLENGYNPARPHSLRSAFRSRLTGKMDEQLIEFLMGHEIGQEKSTYINLPPDELREIYANYEHLLALEKTSRDELAEAQPGIPEEAQQRILSLESTVTRLAEENAGLKEKMERIGGEVGELRRLVEESLR